MQLHVFSFLDQHLHGRAFTDFLRLRKQILVDGLGWKIPHDAHVEMDQYDNPTAVYSVVQQGGRVIAGARAAPCDARWGDWSYMLNDANLGRISAIPKGVLASYPSAVSTWECTRFVSDVDYSSREARVQATKLVVAGLCEIAGGLGADHLISLSPASLGRLLRSFGYNVSVAGRAYRCAEDSRRYRPFTMACDAGVNRDLLLRHAIPGEGEAYDPAHVHQVKFG